MIETLREQKERVERVQLEELDHMRKENQDLKDKLSALQPQKVSQNQPGTPGPTHNQRLDGEVRMRGPFIACVCNSVVNSYFAYCCNHISLKYEA